MTDAGQRNVDDHAPPQRWIWLLMAVCWFATIQLRPLFDPDEARYAEIAREMWASGDWVTPRLNGVAYFEKPPLQYWATAGAYSVFGVSEWAARLWCYSLSFLCILMTYVFVRRLWDARHAIAATLVLATSPYFVLVAHLNLLDAALTFFLTTTLFAFLLAQREHANARAERNWMLLAWGSLALAVLSKGIVAPVLTGATLAAYSLFTGDWRPWRRLQARWGLPLFLLITVPWFWLISARNPGFLQFFFVHEHFARFLTTVHRHAEPWWFFLPIVALGVLPWIGRLWPAIREGWQRPHAAGSIRVERFLVLWCAVVLAFFSVSGSKLVPYALPVMPALAVLLAPRIASDPRATRRAAWISLTLVLICAAGLIITETREGASILLLAWAAAAVLLACLAQLSLRIGRFGRPELRWLPLALASFLAWQSLMMSYGERQSTRSAKPLVAAVRDHVHPGTALYSVGQYRQSASLYLARELRVVGYEGEIEFGLNPTEPAHPTTLPEFESEWTHAFDAIAFVQPEAFAKLRASGLPGQVLAADSHSIVLSRQ
jgi:4-amino-4-deoxy-L-arabinose transferase-like glycosyltransferase